jgi:hypothetical protein
MKRFFSKISEALSPGKTVTWYQFFGLLLCYGVFLTFPLGQLVRVGLGGGGSLYLHEFFLIPAAFLLAPQAIEKIQELMSKRWVGWLAGAWILLGMAVAFSTNPSFVPFLYLLRLGIYVFFILGVGALFAQKQRAVRTWLVLIGCWYWWLALVQYVLLPDTRFLWLYGWDDHYYRMIGTLFDPGLTGILVLLTALAIYLQFGFLKTGKVITAVLLLSIIFTYSRASFIASGVAVLALILSNFTDHSFGKNAIKNSILGVAGVLLIFSIYAVIPKPGGEGVNLLRTSTITARLQSATSSITTMQPLDWVLGKGLFSPQTKLHQEGVDTQTAQTLVNRAVVPDNIFILLITQTGSIGFLCGAYGLIAGLRRLWKLQPVLAVALLAVLIQSQFNNTLLHPYIVLYFGLLLVSYLRFTVRTSST